MAEGWIKLHRQIFDHPFWTDDVFSRAQAWIDLVMLASHKPTWVRKRGIRVDIQRGQVGMSIKGLAIRWKWSQGKVKRFLNELENEEQIGAQINRVTTVITIVNYERYQQVGEQNGEQTVNRRRTDGEQTETIKNVKKVKNEKKNPPKSPTGETGLSVEEFFQRWNRFTSTRSKIASCRKLTATRRAKIAARLREPGWLDDFKEAIQQLPIGGDGWQPTLDWLVRNENNVYSLLEGAFDWKAKDDPAMLLLAKRRREQAAEEREQRLLEHRREQRSLAKQTNEAIKDILGQKGGSDGVPQESSWLFGTTDDSSVNGVEPPSD